MKHLRGGRRAALIVGLVATMTVGITPQAAAGGAGAAAGSMSFCLSTGDCGTLILVMARVNVAERGAVLVASCSVILPSSDPNFVGASIDRCWLENTSTGTQHDFLQNGGTGPTAAAVGGSTTVEDDGSYMLCASGFGWYIDGARPFSECTEEIIRT